MFCFLCFLPLSSFHSPLHKSLNSLTSSLFPLNSFLFSLSLSSSLYPHPYLPIVSTLTSPLSLRQYSWTPLLVATRGNYVDLVNLLLEHRPNLNAMDKDGGTALTIACKEGYTEIATALLNGGAYVNMQVCGGCSLGREGFLKVVLSWEIKEGIFGYLYFCNLSENLSL